MAALHAALWLTAAIHAPAAGPRRRPLPPPPSLYELPTRLLRCGKKTVAVRSQNGIRLAVLRSPKPLPVSSPC